MIDQNTYNQFISEGYTPEEINEALAEAQQEQSSPLQQSYEKTQQRKSNDPMAFASQSMFQSKANKDLIEEQLEIDSILERVEHMLRGDKPTYRDGSVIWTPPTSKEEEVFNDKGVREIMRILSIYINKNTILSNYSEDEINDKVYDVGCEFNDLIFMKYEDFGLDTPEKRKLYPMIVRQITDAVHSTYLRALNGGERESLRKAMSISQTGQINPGEYPNLPGNKQERSLLNPMRYIQGQYK